MYIHVSVEICTNICRRREIVHDCWTLIQQESSWTCTSEGTGATARLTIHWSFLWTFHAYSWIVNISSFISLFIDSFIIMCWFVFLLSCWNLLALLTTSWPQLLGPWALHLPGRWWDWLLAVVSTLLYIYNS